MRFRFLYSQGLKTSGLFRLDFGGMFAQGKRCLPRTLTKSVGSFRALPRDRDCNNAPTTVIAGLLATVY